MQTAIGLTIVLFYTTRHTEMEPDTEKTRTGKAHDRIYRKHPSA